jgi:hypothetical protein
MSSRLRVRCFRRFCGMCTDRPVLPDVRREQFGEERRQIGGPDGPVFRPSSVEPAAEFIQLPLDIERVVFTGTKSGAERLAVQPTAPGCLTLAAARVSRRRAKYRHMTTVHRPVPAGSLKECRGPGKASRYLTLTSTSAAL